MMNESKQAPSSSTLTETDTYAPANEVLELGRKIVEELDGSFDTLGRWMAHYVADLIARAEKATGDDKSIIERECSTAILTLWRHRSELPNGSRPFGELEPVLRAVESLDPDSDIPRYYRGVRPPEGETAATPEQENWLNLVNGLDYSAKVLIGYCLSEAAGASLDKSREWVKLAEGIDTDGVPELIIRFISKVADENAEIDPNESLRSLLDDRLKRLRGFLKIGDALANTIEANLKALPPAKQDSSDGESMALFSRPSIPDF
jgi:hypothetical protein